MRIRRRSAPTSEGRLPDTNPDVWARAFGDGLLLADIPRFLTLNRSAAAVWDALDRHVTLDGLVDDLAQPFDTQPSDLRADVQRVIDVLTEQGFLGSDVARGSMAPLVSEIPVPPECCGRTTLVRLEAAPRFSVRIGRHHLGIHANDHEVLQAAAEVLRSWPVTARRSPANLGIEHPSPERRFAGRAVLWEGVNPRAVSSSPKQLVNGLRTLVRRYESVPPGLVRVSGTIAQAPGGSHLVVSQAPPLIDFDAERDPVEARHRLGCYAYVSVAGSEVIDVDPGDEDRPLRALSPDRRPVNGWFLSRTEPRLPAPLALRLARIASWCEFSDDVDPDDVLDFLLEVNARIRRPDDGDSKSAALIR